MNLPHLLTLAARDGQAETRAKWRNAHRARFIRGKYAEGDMLHMAAVTHRSLSTLYKWGQAAEFYQLILMIILAEPAYNKTVALSILRRAVAELSPWFFHAARETWKYHEDLWVLLGDFDAALDGGWEIGQFRARLQEHYQPEYPTRLEQAEQHIRRGVELLQNTEGDGEGETAARLKAAVMERIINLNGERTQRGQWALLRAFARWG